jgi:hypothetical protein
VGQAARLFSPSGIKSQTSSGQDRRAACPTRALKSYIFMSFMSFVSFFIGALALLFNASSGEISFPSLST